MPKKNRVKLRHPETGQVVFCSEARADEIRADIEVEPKALADMTKAELVEYAKANEISINAQDSKADVLADIEAAEAGEQ